MSLPSSRSPERPCRTERPCRSRSTSLPSKTEEASYFLDLPDDELVEWFVDGHVNLVGALDAAAPTLQCWSFLPAPSPLAFWARRQAHETAIHCSDAESAAGIRSRFGAALAGDGVDELLNGFLARPSGRLVSDPPVRLGVRATDADVAWTMDIGPRHRSVVDGISSPDCLLTAEASDLYLLLWNRREAAPGVEIEGNPAVLDLWRRLATVR